MTVCYSLTGKTLAEAEAIIIATNVKCSEIMLSASTSRIKIMIELWMNFNVELVWP